MEIILFSANVHKCNIAFSTLHVQLCFKSFFLTILYFPLHIRVAVNSVKRIYASAVLAGLCEWKITNVHLLKILTIMFLKEHFKNI